MHKMRRGVVITLGALIATAALSGILGTHARAEAPRAVPLTPGLVVGMRVEGNRVTLDPEFWEATPVEGQIRLRWKKKSPPPVSTLSCRCTNGNEGSCATEIQGNQIICHGSGNNDCNCGIVVVLIDPVR